MDVFIMLALAWVEVFKIDQHFIYEEPMFYSTDQWKVNFLFFSGYTV